MVKNDLRLGTIPGRHIHRSAVHSVAARRVATVCPVERPVGNIEVQIYRLRQVIVILAIGCSLAAGNLQICAEDAALTGIVRPFLGPVELAPSSAHHPHAFTIRPIELASLLLELELLGSKCGALGNNGLEIFPVEISAFDGAII